MDNELVKIIVIGDSLVGKTSFIHRYVNNTYREEYKSTIGVDFALKHVRWADSSWLKLQLWDIAGQERFTFMTRAYYRDARGCILMFDVTNAGSFEKVKTWKADLDAKALQGDGGRTPCLLVANKCDCGRPVVTSGQIAAACRQLGFIGWTVISVKEDLMVKESVNYLLDVIMGRCGPKKASSGTEFTQSVRLHEHPDCHGSSKCSC